jgi:hypothetical protein
LQRCTSEKSCDKARLGAILGDHRPRGRNHGREAERDFGAFYSTFFKTLDGDAAVAALNRGAPASNRKYHFFSAAGVFSKAYLRYHKDHCVGTRGRERIEDLVTQVMQNPNVRRRGVSWARKKVKEGLSNEEAHFEKMKKRFFFIDQYPDNAQRFPLLYKDVLATMKP